MTRDFDAIIIGAGQAVSAADSVFDDVHLLAGLHRDGCICWRILQRLSKRYKRELQP